MPRTQKAASSPKIFQAPIVPVRSSRRLTLAGPSQLISKQPNMPFVFLDVLGTIEKRMPNAEKPKSQTGSKAAVKETRSKRNPKKAKAVKASPKSTVKAMKASPKSTVKAVKASPKSTVKAVKASPKSKAKPVKALSKPKARTVKASPKPTKSPSPRRSRRSVIAKSSPKPSSPKQQKSPTPKSSVKSPPLSRSLRPTRVASPESKIQSTQKSASVARKRDRSASPVNKKKPKVTAASAKKSPEPRRSPVKSVARKRNLSASPASKKKPKSVAASEQRKKSPTRLETPLKPSSRKRKRDTSEERSIDKLSPPQKKQPVETKSRSAVKKSSPKKVSEFSPPQKKSPVLTKSHSAVKKAAKKVGDVSVTAEKLAKVTENAVKSEAKGVSASQQNSTPVKAKLENDVSMNWSLSSIRKRLLAGITPYRMRENTDSPALSNTRQLKSALFSGKKTENTEKRATKRQSVKFAVSGKAEKVKELKQRSARKRVCYRVCQYLLLIGLPVAMTVGTVLIYNGLI